MKKIFNPVLSIFDASCIVVIIFLIHYTETHWATDLLIGAVSIIIMSIISRKMETWIGKDVTDELNND
jgi:Na+/H+ antiporter NhaA